MREIKDEAFSKKWYGFKLTIFPNGKYKMEYNYDPDAVNDPEYYDNEQFRKALGLDKGKTGNAAPAKRKKKR